jgi:hypothetical protein
VEDILEEIGKGFLRGIGYLLADIFFGTVCFWVGWPICRALTLGKYPRDRAQVLPDHWTPDSFFCSTLGLLALIAIGLYLAGAFSA